MKPFIYHIFGILFLISFFISSSFLPNIIIFYRIFLYSIFSLSLIPAIYPKNNYELWQNFIFPIKNLIITLFFTYVMYLGIIIAIAAVNYLFELKISNSIYIYTFYIFSGIYAPFLFLSDFIKPNNKSPLNPNSKILKIIIKYIITPLSLLYLFILYLYSIKIIITWNLPKGLVSYMVISFSILAIMTHFISYPYRKKGIFRFIYNYIYFFILPLLILLFKAIFIRVKNYGLTENRYFIILAGAWILFVSIYEIISKYKNLKLLFISISLVAFFSSFGPWGAFSLAKHSQIKRFENELLKNGLLSKDYQLLPYYGNIDDLSNLKSILLYLDKMDYLKDFTKKIKSGADKIDLKYFFNTYHLEKIQSHYNHNLQYFNIMLETENFLSFNISKYDYLIDSDLSGITDFSHTKNLFDNETTKISFIADSLIVYHKYQKIGSIPIKEIATKLLEKNSYKTYVRIKSDYEYVFDNPNSEMLFVLKSLNGKKTDKNDIIDIINIRFMLLYNVR